MIELLAALSLGVLIQRRHQNGNPQGACVTTAIQAESGTACVTTTMVVTSVQGGEHVCFLPVLPRVPTFQLVPLIFGVKDNVLPQ